MPRPAHAPEGQLAPPALGPYANVYWPDPLNTGLGDVLDAYRNMMHPKEDEMGYYSAGDVGAGPSAALSKPSYSATPDVTYITPARQRQLDKGGPNAAYAPLPRRRINPANVRALRRAMSRLGQFERLARRVIHFTKPKHGTKWRIGAKRRRK